jgi:hypothetical protein
MSPVGWGLHRGGLEAVERGDPGGSCMFETTAAHGRR